MFTGTTKMTLAAAAVAAVLGTSVPKAEAGHYYGYAPYASCYPRPVYAAPVYYAPPVVSYYRPAYVAPVHYAPVYRPVYHHYPRYYYPSGFSFGFGYGNYGHGYRHYGGGVSFGVGF